MTDFATDFFRVSRIIIAATRRNEREISRVNKRIAQISHALPGLPTNEQRRLQHVSNDFVGINLIVQFFLLINSQRKFQARQLRKTLNDYAIAKGRTNERKQKSSLLSRRTLAISSDDPR